MSYGEWDRIPMILPERFRGEPPIFQVIDGYKLELDEEVLKAEKCFSINSGDSYRVSYHGRSVREIVTIFDSEITMVFNQPRLVEFSLGANLDIDILASDIFSYLERCQMESLSPNKSYHNIKGYQERLRELPWEWQESLQAIYDGDGTFVIQSLRE